MIRKTGIILIVVLLSSITLSAQEWFTSFDIAKRLAIVQNKMLFVIWEDAFSYSYPIVVMSNNGIPLTIDLSENDEADNLIWKHFVPVLLPESKYEELYEKIKNYSVSYKEKFNDDSIKIMDVNGYILNTKSSFNYFQNLTTIIKKYGLSTNFLSPFLDSYSKDPNLNSAFNLATKYIDFSVVTPKNVRSEVLGLSDIYIAETKKFLLNSNVDYKKAMIQQLALLKIKSALILGKPGKAKRLMRKLEEEDIYKNNLSIHRFLKYIIFKLNDEEDNATSLQAEMSSRDLKRAELILNINK